MEELFYFHATGVIGTYELKQNTETLMSLSVDYIQGILSNFIFYSIQLIFVLLTLERLWLFFRRKMRSNFINTAPMITRSVQYKVYGQIFSMKYTSKTYLFEMPEAIFLILYFLSLQKCVQVSSYENFLNCLQFINTLDD